MSGDKRCSPAQTEAMINHLLKVKLCAKCDADTKMFQHGAETSIWTKYSFELVNAIERSNQVRATLDKDKPENILEVINGSAAIVNFVK